MTDYTEREVRDEVCRMSAMTEPYKHPKWERDDADFHVIKKMLTRLADILAAAEKAEPVAYRAESNGDISDESEEGAYVYCDADNRDSDHQWEALYTHPAAQPRVVDGFVFERVNMGRGDECYVGLSDGSLGTTITKNGHSEFDTAGQLLWRIADALLAAQEGRSRE
ncbi:hypothetical protein KGP36_08045 [Patescibacteria group bacterium]|nr:hypothetical protein [Patescibacteria group bacterium]